MPFELQNENTNSENLLRKYFYKMQILRRFYFGEVISEIDFFASSSASQNSYNNVEILKSRRSCISGKQTFNPHPLRTSKYEIVSRDITNFVNTAVK